MNRIRFQHRFRGRSPDVARDLARDRARGPDHELVREVVCEPARYVARECVAA